MFMMIMLARRDACIFVSFNCCHKPGTGTRVRVYVCDTIYRTHWTYELLKSTRPNDRPTRLSRPIADWKTLCHFSKCNAQSVNKQNPRSGKGRVECGQEEGHQVECSECSRMEDEEGLALHTVCNKSNVDMHRCICWTFSERGSWPLVASDDDTHNKTYWKTRRPSISSVRRSQIPLSKVSEL